MISKLVGLFHGAFTGIYPYVAIVFLATLSYGLYQKDKVDRTEKAVYAQNLKDTKQALQRVVEFQLEISHQLGVRQRLHETNNKDLQTFKEQIADTKDSCLDSDIPASVAGMFNTSK